jgi:hypothetical protein
MLVALNSLLWHILMKTILGGCRSYRKILKLLPSKNWAPKPLCGDIDIPFPENLGDPMDADPAAVRFQDLFLALKASILADLRYRPPFELRATWTR